MKVIIIGAGPAGISAGYELIKNGVDVEIFEASEYIGGMCRTIELWGQRVDLGPHRFFSKERQVNAFFKEVLQNNYTTINRLTRIYYKNTFFNYPLKFFNVLNNLSLLEVAGILWFYFYQKLFPSKNPSTFEEWVTNRFGKKLFEIFFKNYSEKLWGIPCSKIDADWAAQRIKSLSLSQAILYALNITKSNKHKTLVDEFAYPLNGTGTLYEKTAEYIKEKGGKIHLNAPVRKILLNEGRKVKGVELSTQGTVEADYVISTMPLTDLIMGIGDNVPNKVQEACQKLYYRNTILVYLEIDSINLFKDNWIYVHSPEIQHGRITNFRNWCPSLYRNKKSSIICMEFWAFEFDDLWKHSDDILEKLAVEEIHQLSLIPRETKILSAHVIKIPKSYPVYEKGYQKNLKIIEEYMNTIINLILIGRYGAFKYNNQDHSILMGLLAAEKIIKNKSINLWAINTDTEYQEEPKIRDVLIQ